MNLSHNGYLFSQINILRTLPNILMFYNNLNMLTYLNALYEALYNVLF